MKVLLHLSFLLLSATTLVGAQTLPSEPDEATANRPLNLSVRKPMAPVSDATVILLPPQPGAAVTLPYGAGFENRQQGSNAGSGNTGGNTGSGSAGGSGGGGSSGNGGGGRGGSGRGR